MRQDIDFDTVKKLEQALLTGEVRGSATKLDELIDDEFMEIGKSGRIFSKADIMDDLLSESPSDLQARDFKARALAPGVVLLTYVVSDGTDSSLRSSVWKRFGPDWRIVFHQGTRKGSSSK